MLDEKHVKMILYGIKNVYVARLMAGVVLYTHTGNKMTLSQVKGGFAAFHKLLSPLNK